MDRFTVVFRASHTVAKVRVQVLVVAAVTPRVPRPGGDVATHEECCCDHHGNDYETDHLSLRIRISSPPLTTPRRRAHALLIRSLEYHEPTVGRHILCHLGNTLYVPS